MKHAILKRSLWFLSFGLISCTIIPKENIRETFFKNRPCPEIKFKCLNQENQMQLPSTSYVLTEKDYARIERHKNLRMYKDITRMLDIFYPGFWEGVDEEKQIKWVKQVHKITKKYFPPRPSRDDVESMAHICAIVGIDFETNHQFQFVVNKLRINDWGSAFTTSQIIDYLRFEILKKDYSINGIHYNTWSLKYSRDNMPPFTRSVPDFYAQKKLRYKDKDLYKMYEKYLEEKKYGL